MRKCWLGLSAIMVLLMAVLPFNGVTQAQEQNGQRTRFPNDPEAEQPLPRGLDKGPITVFVELTGQPAAVAYAARKQIGGSDAQATAEGKSVLAQNLQAQNRIAGQLRAIRTPELYRVQRVLNGIAVRADATQVASISRLPGVKRVTPIVTKSLDNATSVPLIGAPELWRPANGGFTGEGISIGIIDTGVDYLHTDFGGPGEGYDTYDFTINEAGGGFPSARVVGGYDFAGDDYDADSNDPNVYTPKPDPDPMDCNGHGSHVAGTAAGSGVRANGSTYTSPYNQNTPFGDLRIGPGVAPKADIYALRVFGCNGTTDLTDAAIEWAVDPNGDGDFSDHLDVINMSLGSSYGGSEDSSAIASNNAVLAGVIVATSAGNAGNTNFIHGSPGSAERVVSTASSADSAAKLDKIVVNSPPSIAGDHPASLSVLYDWDNDPNVTGKLVYPASQSSGCFTEDEDGFNAENKALINGNIVLIRWTDGECGSIARSAAVEAAGGIGVIMFDDSEVFDLSISGSEVIPAVSTPRAVGLTLLDHIDENINVTLTDEDRGTFNYDDPELTDTMSAFSSRGPVADMRIKPDVTAPGQTIYSAGALTGDQGETISGTSMAAPHVAGALALLKEIHPDWTPEQLKALLMNTAGQDIRTMLAADSQKYGPARQGAGRIELPKAAASNVIAYNADGSGTVSVSFGEVEVLDTVTLTKTVLVQNLGDASEKFDVFYAPVTTIPGVTFSVVGPSSLTLAAGQSVSVTVQLDADAAQMRNTRDQTLPLTQVGYPRAYLSEIQGYLRITPNGAPAGRPSLRVPMYANAHAVSDMKATQGAYDFTSGITNTITLQGKDLMTGTDIPTDTISLVSVLELQGMSDAEPGISEAARGADLKYVGVTSNVGSTGAITDINTIIYFGVATHGEWSTAFAADAEFDIYINTDDDAAYEYVMYNANIPSGADGTDVFVTRLINLTTGTSTYQEFINGAPATLDTAPFNNTVMTLPVYATDLGLTAENSRFTYDVVTFSRAASGAVDVLEGMNYDPLAPGIDSSATESDLSVDGVTYADLDGAELTIAYDEDAYAENGSQGILLLHHHNLNGAAAEVVQPELIKTSLPLVFK